MADIRIAVDGATSFPEGVTPFSRLQGAVKPRPGDFYLTHQKDNPWWKPAFAMIRLGQALRYKGEFRKYAHWNHAGIFVDDNGQVVEALNNGVVTRQISAYRAEEYTVVYLDMTDEDRTQVANIAKQWVGAKYGWLNIVNIGMRIVFGGKLSYSRADEKICSGLVAYCLTAAGYTWRGYDVNRMMPADLAWLASVDYEEATK
jgi:hypothetical protein